MSPNLMRGKSPRPQLLSQLETAEEAMPATLSKAKSAPFFNAKKHTFSDDFKTLPHKGKCLIGVKIELIGNEKRPILIFEDARVDEIESPSEAEFAGVLRSIFHDNTRPKFVFQSILHPNPFSGRQYCRYSPSWMRGTHLGKLTIEADVWMKLLASNIKPVRGDDGEITFVPWNENTCLNYGIKTWHDFRSVHSSGSIFLECKEVEVCETDDGLLFPTDPIMQIKSKASPKFGDYLSSIYDDVVADGAIVFERVRELPKMIVIAEWLKKKGVKIDDEWLWEQAQPHPSAVPETFQSVKSSVEPLQSLRRATRRQILKSKICTLAQVRSPCKKEKVIVGPYGPIHLDAKFKVLDHLRYNDQHRVHAVIEAYVAGTSVLLYELPVTVLASSNDEDIDWVYEGLPEIPIDRSPFLPDVTSWSELHEQSIDPFCSVFVSKRHEESADVIRRCWNGGCSMESFHTKRVEERERECRRPVKSPLPMDFTSSTGVNSKEKDTVSDLFQASGAGNPLSCKSESKSGLAKVPAGTDDAPLKSCVYLSQPGLPQPGFPLAWSTKFDIKEILSALNNPFAATLLQYAALNGKEKSQAILNDEGYLPLTSEKKSDQNKSVDEFVLTNNLPNVRHQSASVQFPSNTDDVTDNVVKACALVGASKWDVLASFLLEDHEIQEIKEKSENYKVRLLAVLKSWVRKEPFQPTVGKLLKWCKEAGVCKREIVKKYETIFAQC